MKSIFHGVSLHSAVGRLPPVKDGETFYSKVLKRTRRNETREVEQVQQADVFDRRSPFAILKDLSVGS